MRGMLAAFIMLLFFGFISYASAHTTVEVAPYSIEVGWGIEPPVVSYRNTIVLHVSEQGDSPGTSSGVKNAFQNLDAVVKFGGASKQLDVHTNLRVGHYAADIIPTRTGSYSVELTGEINGVPVSVDVPIEDAESTAILDFPPKTAGSEDLGPLKQALSSLQRDVADLKAGGISAGPSDTGAAYDFAVFGLSLGAAGVILAVVSMLKRK